jgi:hypothetical protein
MEDIKLYRSNLESRFNYHISFWSSIVSFFTHSSPYDEAIEQIHKMDIKDALKSDAQQLHRDFHHACRKQHFDLLGVNCPEKQLADACE